MPGRPRRGRRRQRSDRHRQTAPVGRRTPSRPPAHPARKTIRRSAEIAGGFPSGAPRGEGGDAGRMHPCYSPVAEWNNAPFCRRGPGLGSARSPVLCSCPHPGVPGTRRHPSERGRRTALLHISRLAPAPSPAPGDRAAHRSGGAAGGGPRGAVRPLPRTGHARAHAVRCTRVTLATSERKRNTRATLYVMDPGRTASSAPRDRPRPGRARMRRLARNPVPRSSATQSTDNNELPDEPSSGPETFSAKRSLATKTRPPTGPAARASPGSGDRSGRSSGEKSDLPHFSRRQNKAWPSQYWARRIPAARALPTFVTASPAVAGLPAVTSGHLPERERLPQRRPCRASGPSTGR